MTKGIVLTILLSFYFLLSSAQDSNYVMRHIKLDSVIVSASQYGFDIPDFIRRVEEDTTFYKAFKNLRILSYREKNDIRLFNKKGKVKASLKSITKQQRKNGCRSMKVIKEKTSGNFYKKDSSYNYYTAQLYADLFFTKGKVCGETNKINDIDPKTQPSGSIARHEEQLKQLIFNPGHPIQGIPFVGNKVAIFDDNIAPMYDFSIHSASYDTSDCYVFTAKAKPQFKDNVVINHLVTYFNKKNMEIVYRDYSLSYHTILFHFDVNMKVSMTHFDELMVPQHIDYDGNWKIIFKKAEKAIFSSNFSQFSKESSF